VYVFRIIQVFVDVCGIWIGVVKGINPNEHAPYSNFQKKDGKQDKGVKRIFPEHS
jgi:hypothetical protein